MKHHLPWLLLTLLVPGCAGGEHVRADGESVYDLPNLSAPAVGQTYKSLYGRTVRRMTDYKKEGVDYIQAEYATQNHFNADATVIKLEFPDGTLHLMKRDTREWLGPVLKKSQSAAWHPTDPNLLLYVDADGKNLALKHLDISSGKSETEMEAPEYRNLESGGEADISPDGNKLVFIGTQKSGKRQVVVYDRERKRLSERPLDITDSPVNWVHVTNTRVLVGYELDAANCAGDIPEHERFFEPTGNGRKLIGCQPVRIFGTDLQPVWEGGRTLLASYWGHGDVGMDATDGNREVWVMADASRVTPRAEWFPQAPPPLPANCENSLIRFTLDRPSEPTCLKTGAPGLSWDLAMHVALPGQPSEWAYATLYRTIGDTQYGALAAPTPTPPCPPCTVPFQNEIVRFRLDGSGFERLTHTYSSRYLPGDSTYNWQPRASVEGAGRFMLFNSNFGTGDSCLASDVYMLELPPGPASH
jgi:hypothetical protein